VSALPAVRRAAWWQGSAAALMAAAMLAGCGGSSDTAGAPATSQAGPTTSSSPRPPPSAPARHDTGPDGFLSPSRNIGCHLTQASVRCDIREREWSAPPKPADCLLDWGHALAVSGDAPGGFRCAGDTAIGDQPVLPYGSVVRRGPVECRSEETGVECVNLDTGHGFAVSRAEYRLF
jgi:hypothetical protein